MEISKIRIRKTSENDISDVLEIYAEARGTIKSLGIDQWQNGYPTEDVLRDDIARGASYVAESGGNVTATFALIDGGDASYDEIDGGWLTAGRNYTAMHRVAVRVSSRGSGISWMIVDFALRHASENGKSSVRIDTHEGNAVMRRMLEKNGFVYCGVISLRGGIEEGQKRVAYEKKCPNEQ